MGTREQTAQAWVNAGKVASIEEYYEKTGVSTEPTAEPVVEVEVATESPKPKRRRRKSK